MTQRNLLDAWRQVTEILLCCVPLDILPSSAKQQLLLELLQVKKIIHRFGLDHGHGTFLQKDY